jgi:hypothetical protein
MSRAIELGILRIIASLAYPKKKVFPTAFFMGKLIPCPSFRNR